VAYIVLYKEEKTKNVKFFYWLKKVDLVK